MEIPSNLKRLYKHWFFHTQTLKTKRLTIDFNDKALNEIKQFAIERQKIWKRKITGKDKPYTRDKILQKYRFCNVYRELDRQTIEIHSMLKPMKRKFDTWLLNVLFCRMICNTETVKKVGFLSFDSADNKRIYKRLTNLPSPKFGSAYIFPISLIMKSAYPTREEFFCFYLPKVVEKCTKVIFSCKRAGVVDVLEQIIPEFGFNFKFHWTEVLIDVAYQFPEFVDLYKKFPIGPGSKQTMKLFSRNESLENTCLALTRIPFKEFPHLLFRKKPVLLSAENWEGIGCEYRKYLNLKKGKGRRRLFD